jgi:hypothetical protein
LKPRRADSATSTTAEWRCELLLDTLTLSVVDHVPEEILFLGLKGYALPLLTRKKTPKERLFSDVFLIGPNWRLDAIGKVVEVAEAY